MNEVYPWPRWYYIASGALMVAQGVVVLLSFAYIIPQWDYDFWNWVLDHNHKELAGEEPKIAEED